MNNQWSEFITTQGEVENDPSPASCVLNDLSHYGLLQIEGEDAQQFLQGQMTNDMREVTEQHSNLCGWCTAKGRMMANFRAMRQGDTYLLQTPADNMGSVLKRLQMYVLMAKVTITDVSDRLARFGLTGECAENLLQPHFPSIPTEANESVTANECILIRVPGSPPRFQVIGPPTTLIQLWKAFSETASIKGRGFWALQEIRAGIPTVFPATTEAFVPQMANMQLIDGVSFTKGCYTGQEVVARMQYLGKLKRRMYLAHVNSDTLPKPGDELFARNSESGQGTGKIIDAQPAAEGYDLLAVIEIASAENDEVCLGTDGPRLEILDLPYAFSAEE